MTKEQKLNILKKFVGNKVDISYKIDSSYRIDGTPQYNPIVRVNGVLKYDRYDDRTDFTREDYKALEWYGKETYQYTKKINCLYGMYDIDYCFIVSEKIIKLLANDEGINYE